jgi:MFS family permease
VGKSPNIHRPAAFTQARVFRALGLAHRGEQRYSPWGVLRAPLFRWYFTGAASSDLGTWVQNTAQVLLAYRLSHSVLAVGIVTCAQFTSPLVLGPWAGVLADRIGGTRTLLWTELVSAIFAGAVSILVFTHIINEPWLILCAICTGLTFTFALPARNVTVRRLVAKEQTRSAFAMDSVSYNLGRAVGPPLGILLVTVLGFGYAFAFNALSFLVFTVVLLTVARATNEPEMRGRSRVLDGFRVARDDRRILMVLAMVVAVTVAADPVLVLGPALASRTFGVSANWSGAFIAALGAGSVLGSLLRTKREPTMRLAATALFALGVCMICFVLAPRIWLSLACAFGAGITCLIANSTTRTLLASKAGPAREASVMAIWAIAWAGSKPVASLADGWIATTYGVRTAGILLAVPAIVPLILLLSWSRIHAKARLGVDGAALGAGRRDELPHGVMPRADAALELDRHLCGR